MHKKAYKEGLTMKKWYRKTVTRTIVLVVAILSGALLVTNLLSLLTLAGGMSLSQIQKMNTQSFEESEEFSKIVVICSTVSLAPVHQFFHGVRDT